MRWHPLRFAPIYRERVWGGRSMESQFHRALPGGRPIGESWEIADRPDALSIVSEGPLSGRTLADLLRSDPAGLLGDAVPRAGRFPLLVKILDARDTLSLQVHPPAACAAALGGETKTELWYFTASHPGAEIFAGLRPGTTRDDFEASIASGTVDRCFHRVGVGPGDAMFLPSGRVHALGAGLMLFEIQENSDTTYRVFDWNRVGLDGSPRALHVAESLASIDFTDFAPGLVDSDWKQESTIETRLLTAGPPFRAEARRAPATASPTFKIPLPRCVILGVVHGSIRVLDDAAPLQLGAGDFCLLPAALREVTVDVTSGTEWIQAEPNPGARINPIPGCPPTAIDTAQVPS